MSEMVSCLSCGNTFEDYQGLAQHILASKKGHRKGKRWAAKYIHRHIINKHNHDTNGRTPLTAEDKANKEKTLRVLSGEQKIVETICPKCKISNRTILEIEYVSSPYTWKAGGRIVKLCAGCEG